MKKAYSLDYSIERDTDRVQAVRDILDSLPNTPSKSDLEQMGSYILYGKDENGLNTVQRGETYDGNSRRFNSFKKAEDKVVSLDEVLENPMADQQRFESPHRRYIYVKKKPGIRRPRIDKETGEIVDIGDGDIPGIWDVWDSIDRLEHWIAILEKKIPPDEIHQVIEVDSYRLYQLKHQLIDLRRHQYYLKDSYKPTLFFVAADHPKQQFINWAEDSAYWMPLDQWERKVNDPIRGIHFSKNLEDYETREGPEGIEVRWVVRRHIFDWEDPQHIRALIMNYDALYDYFKDKLDTYGRTLIFDFERYLEMADLSEVRRYMLKRRIEKASYLEIANELNEKFGITYNDNHVCSVVSREIPRRIAAAVTRHRLIVDTPADQLKTCHKCNRNLPRNTIFYARNRSRKDGFSSVCKECERNQRIEQGGQSRYDRRNKEAEMHEVPSGKT